MGCWHGYLSGARCRLHMAQLMPLPLTVYCFSKIQIGFTFLVQAHPGSPGQRSVKCVCVCVCVQARLSLVMSHVVAAVVPFHVDDDTGEKQTSAEHAESDADSDHHEDSCHHTPHVHSTALYDLQASSAAVTYTCYRLPVKQNNYRLSLTDPRDKIVLYTELDDLCDKLAFCIVSCLYLCLRCCVSVSLQNFR